MVQVIQVPKGDPRLKGFDSYVVFKRNNFNKSIIYQDKTQSAEEKLIGEHHEKCHIACRHAYGRDYKPTFSAPVKREIRTHPLYKFYSKEYSNQKVPEEVYCEMYAWSKSGAVPKTWRERKFARKYPKTNEFMKKEMDSKTGLRW